VRTRLLETADLWQSKVRGPVDDRG